VTIAGLVVSIALSGALVPSLGAEGASIASAVCEFAVAGGYLLSLVRRDAQLRPSLAVLPRVALAGGAAVSTLLLPLPSIVLWVIATAVYVTLLLLLRAFPEELLHVLVRRND
jgi:O-antigen/teichoic acid export membrane protein